ncbi:hypothetical protein ABIE65_003130 [Constrictibacter sp. MBR-5]|jgi:hypothetical protein|uniref:DUF4055 domain-containing protein n=1 Tax=Constrictibacter sp. MBR-5 TaxID=3156467 RepID=UPI0033984774
MVDRTVNGLLGSTFRREPVTRDLPEKLAKRARKITKDNQSFATLTKILVRELLSVGRAGVLLDMGASGETAPYLALYKAEQILDWTTDLVDGRVQLTEVVLAEQRGLPREPGSRRTYITDYRCLRLVYDAETDAMVYESHLYRGDGDTPPNLANDPDEIVRPVNRGKPFNQILFRFFGATSNNPDVEKPPILDIVEVNLSHYRSYAQLEHGRFYTALPVYYAPVTAGSSETGGDYYVGPSTVWEVPAGASKPGILEYSGQGLGNLESALRTKEDQIAALGGRLLGGSGMSSGQSDQQAKLQDRNEQSLLLGVVTATESGLTDLLRHWAIWQDIPAEAAATIRADLNADLSDPSGIGARELRAIALMHKDGVLPLSVVFSYLRKAQVVPDWLTEAEFAALLADPRQFPNQPDTLARQAGYPDAESGLVA